MKEFGAWVQSMAGSIRDLSHVGDVTPKDKTPSQVRMDMANLLIGIPDNPEKVDEWLHIFALAPDRSTMLRIILSEELFSEYLYAKEEKMVDFQRKLTTLILKGEV